LPCLKECSCSNRIFASRDYAGLKLPWSTFFQCVVRIMPT
jgi:hypothetical protein